ncbi:MAG: tetratricopeptide repeat protein [Fastidiosipilaceae bacterium]|jgi:tetratricopeptide (TPR) repeat protein
MKKCGKIWIFISLIMAVSIVRAGKEFFVQNEREVAACNLLTMYLCVLEDLQGRGFLVVRQELINNVNTAGLLDDSKRLFRRLLDTCDHAETTLDSLGYVREDASEKWGQALGNNIGWSAGVSIAVGDVTPLIEGALKLTQQGVQIEKAKRRELNVIVQSYLQLLSKVQFEVNSRRGDLIHENNVAPNLFVTKSHYENFKEAMEVEDQAARVSALRTLCAQCPSFREAQYYLADALYSAGDITGAASICASLAEKNNPILQRDGFIGAVKADLGFYLLQQGKLKESLECSRASLVDKPANASAYNNIAVALIQLQQYDEARQNCLKSLELEPGSAWYYWTRARIEAAAKASEETQLVFLRAALLKGFDNFEAIRNFLPLASALKTPFGTHLLHPQLDVKIDFDLLLDDLDFTNASHFSLSGVKGKAKFTIYSTNDQEEETIEIAFSIPSLDRGEKFCVSDVASLPENRTIRIDLSYTCDQQTFSREQTFYYNWFGTNEQLEKDDMLNKIAWRVYENRDSSSYTRAINLAQEAVAYSLRQVPYILDTLAWLYYEQGNKPLAKQLLNEAIQVLDRDNQSEKAKQYRKNLDTMK